MHFSTFITALAGASSVLAGPILMQYTKCDVSKVTVDPSLFNDPKNASNHLQAPLPSDKLVNILLGVGTQNYSCVNGVATANGAFANLYDVSCPIKYDAELAELLTPMAVKSGPNAAMLGLQAFSSMFNAQFTAGDHFFKGDFATPAFELNTNYKSGKFYGAVFNKVTAPLGSSAGKAPDNFGAVPSLKLMPKAGMGSTFTTVYRLHTAGGAVPSTNGVNDACTWTGVRKIPYAALYYFYASA